MQTYQLSGPQYLHPLWFNRVRSGKHAATVELSAGQLSVVVYEELLHLPKSAYGMVNAGTAVMVWLNMGDMLVCATLDEIEREAQAQREALTVEADRLRQRLNVARAEAVAFNSMIVLPVRWDVGVKDVLSGLSDNSWGDGRSKATVDHIYLLEPLQALRLTRNEGDFLCTSACGSNGKRWSSRIVERRHDGEGNPYQPKVTCKACLALAKRWVKESS